VANVRKRGRIWYFRFVDADGTRVERRGCTDKRATEQLASHAESEANKIRAGLVDPKADAYRRHEARPMVDHLIEYRAYLADKGNTAKHAELTWARAARVVALSTGARLADIVAPSAARAARVVAGSHLTRHLAGVRLSDLGADRAQAALAALKGTGRALETVNAHTRAVKGFSRWLWRIAGRTRDDALAPLSLVNADVDRRHERRALSDAEAGALVQAAERGGRAEGMAGPDRAMLYKVAMGTGLRAAELRSLTPESFRLDTAPPTIVCEAGHTKNGRRAEQPIADGLATALRPWLARRPADRPTFDAMPRVRTARMVRVDLDAAGIPYRDGSGRVADFHSLRTTFITSVVSGGASVKTAQVLARHASPVLTIGRYAQVAIHDQRAALASLPDLDAPEPSTRAATGTDGQRIKEGFAPPLPHTGDVSGRFQTDADANVGKVGEVMVGRKENPEAGLCASGRVLTDRRRPDSNRGIADLQSVAHSHLTVEPGRHLRLSAKSLAPRVPHDMRRTPRDLAEVVDAWDRLPESVRAGVVALVRACKGG